jgi:hypothetical protein
MTMKVEVKVPEMAKDPLAVEMTWDPVDLAQDPLGVEMARNPVEREAKAWGKENVAIARVLRREELLTQRQ